MDSEINILDIKPNTDKWIKYRLKCLCASEAPAMMNQSKFMTRVELLDLKKGWQKNPDSSFMSRIFEKGHENEDKARPIIEAQMCDKYPAAIVTRNIPGVKITMLASLDGRSESGETWEHKDWNATLSENVKNGVFEPHYYWQLEHQLLVNGTEECLFTCSDGTHEKRATATYRSVPQRRNQLIEGWKLFCADLDSHEIEAKVENVLPRDHALIPAVSYEISNGVITSNAREALDKIVELSIIEGKKTLQSDQDFADKEAFNKSLKSSREKLKSVLANVKDEFSSAADFERLAIEIDGVLQRMSSAGEKLIKHEKEKRKAKIIDNAGKRLAECITLCNERLSPANVLPFSGKLNCDFKTAIKGKSSASKMISAVECEVNRCKIELTLYTDKAVENLRHAVDNMGEFSHLFNDLSFIIAHEKGTFIAIFDARILHQKKIDDERLENLRIRKIVPDYQRKIEKQFIDNIKLEEKKKTPGDFSFNLPAGLIEAVNLWALKHKVTESAIQDLNKIIGDYR